MLINLNLPSVRRLMISGTIIASIGLSTISQTYAVQKPVASNIATSPEIVIVHGAWGGGHQWRAVADALQAAEVGRVHRVTLTGQGERVHLASPENDLSTHIQDVVNVIKFEQLENVILIGHSYGGAVISGVANQIPDKLAQLIYLDSNLLEDGESFFSLMPEKREHYTRRANEGGDGWLIPADWEEAKASGDVPHQLATLTSIIKLDNPQRLKIPSTYWLFADGKPAEQDERQLFLKRAKALKWSTRVFAWGHNPQKSRPVELARELAKELANANLGNARGQNGKLDN